MGEVHAHVFSNRLNREIVIIDKQGSACLIMHYKPGYAAAKQISTRSAQTLRNDPKSDALWLLMIPDHFEALQPTA